MVSNKCNNRESPAGDRSGVGKLLQVGLRKSSPVYTVSKSSLCTCVLSVVLLFTLFLAPGGVFSATYYVDSLNGQDLNTGTQAAPWKTASQVNSVSLAPGDTVLFRRGQTFPGFLTIKNSGTASQPVRIGTYGTGEKPVIRSMVKWTPAWRQYQGSIWVADRQEAIVEINGRKATLESYRDNVNAPYEWYRNEKEYENLTYLYAPQNPTTYYGDTIYISKDEVALRLENVQYLIVEDIVFQGGKYYVAYISNVQNITLRGIAAERSIYHGLRFVDASTNTILNSTVADTNRDGIVFELSKTGARAENNRIEGNTVRSTGQTGIHLRGIDSDNRISNNIVTGNTSFDNGDGVYLNYSSNNTISYNNLYGNKRQEWFGAEGYGIGVQTGSNNLIEGNTIRDNRTSGIEIWGGQPAGGKGYGPSSGNKVYRNTIFDNDLQGLMLSSLGFVTNTEIVYNTIYNNAREAILISHAGNVGTRILNNTTYGNEGNTLFYYQAARPEIANNLFASGKSVTIFSDTTIGPNGFAGAPLRWNGTAVPDNTVPSYYPGFTIGQPDFADAAAGNFRLKAGSPFINKGVPAGFNTDITSAPLVGNPDLGAFEYASESPTATPVLSPSPEQTPVPTAVPTATPQSSPGCTRKREGDANCDGLINLLDLEIWVREFLKEWNTTRADFSGTSECVDTNGNPNAVCTYDLEIWRRTYIR